MLLSVAQRNKIVYRTVTMGNTTNQPTATRNKKGHNMDEIRMIKRFFQLDVKDIAYFKFILESYEGIAMQRTLNAKRGEIEVQAPSSNTAILDDILNGLNGEIQMREIKKPVDYLELVI